MPDVADDALKIDELARASGMTVRNIRAHQSRGLLPPPDVRGRTGYYGAQHVARLELIKEMQAEGYNLELIRKLLLGSDESGAELLRFTRAIREPFEDEEPEIIEAADLAERWASNDLKLLERSVELGLLRPIGDGRYESLSPRLTEAGAELAAVGVPLDKAIETVAQVRRHADSIARSFVRLYLEAVWKPFDDAGRPPEQWGNVSEAIERLRPLAAQTVAAIFPLAMTDAVDDAFGRELQRMSKARKRR